MSSSRTFKFAGSTIAVLTGFTADSPSPAITGATRARPCVITVPTHGLADGAVLKLSGMGLMTSLEGGVFVANVLTVNTIELVGTDTRDDGAYVSGGHMDVASFSNFCELTGYNRPGGSSGEIDSTSLCSDAKEFELDLPDAGTTQLDFKFAPQTPIQLAITAFNLSKDIMAVRVDLPKSGGRRVQLGRIQQTSEAAAKGGLWTGSITIRNTGPYADFAAAA